MRLIHILAGLAVMLLLSATLVSAQVVSGQIRGTVTDPTGAVITKATVTVSDPERAIKRTAAADSTGAYLVPGLPPAMYVVTINAPGFEPEVQKSVVVNIGQTITLDFHLKVSAATEAIEVTSAPPVVDTERGSQAEVINQQLIQDLPIDRRDYLTFALLDPAVSSSVTLAGADGRVRQTPQTGLSVYGGNGRGNNVTVDGGSFNGDSGAVLPNLSQDAVQEFQINRTNYSAELGAASGASINIVSKSGSNGIHGTAYGFFRNDAMDAANPFAATNALQPGQLSAATGFNLTSTSKPTKDTLNRQQFGATLSLPLQKDKTFLFLSAEGLHERKQNAVTLLRNSAIFGPQSAAFGGNDQVEILTGLAGLGATPVPCLTGQPALPAATCAGILQNVLTINPAASPLSKFLVNEFETNGGLFAAPTTNVYFSGRLDHTFNEQNQAYLRYLWGRNDDSNPDVSGLEGISRGSAIKQWTSSILGSFYHQFSPTTQNEFHAQWNLVQFNVLANDAGGPAFDVSGFGAVGRDQLLPDFSTLRQYEFADNLTMVRGHHTVKAGIYEDIRGNRTASATFLSGDFSFGALPGGILSPCLQVPAACGLTGVTPAVLDSLQAFNLGLPSTYEQGFGNPTTVANLPLTAFYLQDAWQVVPRFNVSLGARYEIDKRWVMPTDNGNVAPRLSFAWDPFNDHKTVIRGGAGIFFSPTYVQIDFATKELGVVSGIGPQIQNFLVPLTGEPGNPAINSAAIFQSLFAVGALGTGGVPNNPCNISGGPSGAGAGSCITQATLAAVGFPSLSGFPVIYHVPNSFHNPYSEQASLGIERQVGNSMSISASYIYVHTLRLPRSVDTNLLPTAPIVSGVPGTNGRPFQSWNSSSAPQCALIVNNPCFVNPLIAQSPNYESNAAALYQGGTLEFKKRFSEHYTLTANYTYSKAYDDTTDFNFFPANEANLSGDRGLSSFDQRHKLIIAGVFDSPFQSVFLSGFQFSPIVHYNSGHPFDLLAGSDINGDRHGDDRPAGYGRNTGIGPNYFDIDARLSRAFKIGERNNLQFMAEGFNLFNRLNFATVNNTVGPTYNGPVHPTGNQVGFTSAFPGREIQLGARFTF
jgi:hypothetical protein